MLSALGLLGCEWLGISDSTTDPLPEQSTDELQACGAGPLFTAAPIALSDLLASGGITPLGNTDAPAHTFPTPHLYFMIRDSGLDGAPVDNVPVYAPGEIVITEINSSENLTQGYTDSVDPNFIAVAAPER